MIRRPFLPFCYILINNLNPSNKTTLAFKVHRQQSSSLKQLVSSYNEGDRKRLIYFPVNGDSIEVIQSPNLFYDKLKKSIYKASKRVILSSLYIGTGQLEKELVHALDSRLNQVNDLNVNILLDYNRGQRLNQRDDVKSSSKGLLQDLAHRANIFFFLSPAFGSFINYYLLFPIPMINEIISLQHIKCYIFDDNLIISGANLSADYFTNRQDRYIYIRNCGQLCDYLESVIKLIGKVGYRLSPNGDLKTTESNFNPFDTPMFIKTFEENLTSIQSNYKRLDQDTIGAYKTVIIPTLQMKCLKLTEDGDFTRILFSLARNSSQTNHLVSGYFNPTKDYVSLLTQSNTPTRLNVLAASEEANGFYKASGLKSLIPSIYTNKSTQFLRAVKNCSANVQFFSYTRKNWTFHVKGFWTYLDDGSYVASIGSSNYGYRSVERDLEMQFTFVTKNASLIRKLNNERDQLWKYAISIEDENQLPTVSLKTKLMSFLIGDYF